jgi:DNA-directed RNA polymerase specialized sigma subunit
MTFPTPIQPPKDGFTELENEFLRSMVIDVYRILKSPKDKFILMSIQEMGYTQEVVGKMLNMTQVRVCLRLQKIKEYVRKHKLMKDMQ